jgi:glycerol-3-phosphate dehydrogenase (NAD(P)+)
MSKIAVIGAGSWGTAFAGLLAGEGKSVALWDRNPELIDAINTSHVNPRYLTDVRLPAAVKAVGDLSDAVVGADIVAMVVPSQAVRGVMEALAPSLRPGAIVVSLAKGLECGTLKRMTEIIRETAPAVTAAALSGPNHAEEVSHGIPSATVVASPDESAAKLLQEEFMTAAFRVYRNRDLVGVELAGATKNVIALAAGISDGLGFGDNAKASLITRGLAEMTRLGKVMGADPGTFAGLAGMGDLVATCTSRHSRNRAVGERLARGLTADEAQAELGMVAEGVKTAESVRDLALRERIEMPLSLSVYDVIYRGKDPRECVQDLMSRGPVEES